jgi:hypothetical protein
MNASRITKVIIAAALSLGTLAAVAPVASASPATASPNVTLICTSAAGLDYALQLALDTSESPGSVRAMTAMAETYGYASGYEGGLWLTLDRKLTVALGGVSTAGSLRPLNAAFGAVASACKSHGAPIVLVTLTMPS